MDGNKKRKTKRTTYTEIGRKHHIDPRTAKKYAESDSVPKYATRIRDLPNWIRIRILLTVERQTLITGDAAVAAK